MKKLTALLTVLSMVLYLFAGCGSTEKAPKTEAPAEPVELIVFAAASMTETLTTLGDQYMKDHPEVTIVFNFDSSGTLKTQSQEGAECDLRRPEADEPAGCRQDGGAGQRGRPGLRSVGFPRGPAGE